MRERAEARQLLGGFHLLLVAREGLLSVHSSSAPEDATQVVTYSSREGEYKNLARSTDQLEVG